MAERKDGEFDLDLEVMKKKYSSYLDFIARYYGDPDYRERVDQDPTAAARAAGVEIPEGARVKLSFNTDDRIHIVIPRRRS